MCVCVCVCVCLCERERKYVGIRCLFGCMSLSVFLCLMLIVVKVIHKRAQLVLLIFSFSVSLQNILCFHLPCFVEWTVVFSFCSVLFENVYFTILVCCNSELFVALPSLCI